MKRTAHCSCGSLQIIADGEPTAVVACQCTACQRRTGSVLGVGAYFPESRVTIFGAARVYVRSADTCDDLTSHFCPACGTPLFWKSGSNPGSIGIAVGAFADPYNTPPIRALWERRIGN